MHIIPRQRHKSAFTLIELLIVIIVIAIIALIVIPRLLSATRKAREARLRDNLRTIRAAVELFQSDTGEFPGELTDIVAGSADQLSATISDTAKSLYRGPYLNTNGPIQLPGYPGMPANPFVPVTNIDVSAHWNYNRTTGVVGSAVSGVTLQGVPYSDM